MIPCTGPAYAPRGTGRHAAAGTVSDRG
jgi:hypothetical protein